MLISSVEEFMKESFVFWVDFSVVDEVLASVFSVVIPRILWEASNESQHFTVGS